MVHSLLTTAKNADASDIIISSGEKPSMKVYGSTYVLSQYDTIGSEQVYSMLQELTSTLQISDIEQKKDLDLGIEVPGIGRYRLNIFFTHNGPAFVLRMIKEHIPSFEEIHVPNAQFQAMTAYPNGLVLFTGAMGSGKSTSLASVLDYINRNQDKHIVTIEDPIEYKFQNNKSVFQQREVPQNSESFKKALRGALRQAADVIMIGEMRDIETISLALEAAETGALVFSTLHTAGVENTIDRIINSYPKEQQEQIRTMLSQVLRAVVWQVLLPKRDGQGRVPATEIMFNSHAIGNLIRKGETHQIPSHIEISRQMGMMTMAQSTESLVQQGMITEEVAKPYLPSEEEYM